MLAWRLDELSQRVHGLAQAGALARGGDVRGPRGAPGDGIGDEARLSAVRGIALPVARVLSKEAVRAPLGEMPFHSSPERIRMLLHVEAEREGADGDPVADDRAPRVLLHHI